MKKAHSSGGFVTGQHEGKASLLGTEGGPAAQGERISLLHAQAGSTQDAKRWKVNFIFLPSKHSPWP